MQALGANGGREAGKLLARAAGRLMADSSSTVVNFDAVAELRGNSGRRSMAAPRPV